MVHNTIPDTDYHKIRATNHKTGTSVAPSGQKEKMQSKNLETRDGKRDGKRLNVEPGGWKHLETQTKRKSGGRERSC